MTSNPKDRFFSSHDGTGIHYLEWKTNLANPQGCILVVHGAGEYAERYSEFANYFNLKGWSVYGIDLRGYGSSGGVRAYVDSLDDYSLDLHYLIRFLQRFNDSNLPFFLFGHSLGGLVTSYSVANTVTAPIAGLILSSPCFGLSISIPSMTRFMASILARVKPKTFFKAPRHSNILTHDLAIIRDHESDERIIDGMTAKLFFEMNRVMASYQGIARRIRVPVAIFQSGTDLVVDKKRARCFYELLIGEANHYKEYEGMYHEILNEVGRQEVYDDIIDWMQHKKFQAA